MISSIIVIALLLIFGGAFVLGTVLFWHDDTKAEPAAEINDEWLSGR